VRLFAPRSFALLALLAIALPGAASAAWPVDPLINLAVCTADQHQYAPKAVSDGAGGSIVTWYDYRAATASAIYAQHVLAGGGVDPAWPANGQLLGYGDNLRSTPTIASDGSGGAVVTWYDHRGTTNDIYAQRVLASGALAAGWPVSGLAVTLDVGEQANPRIISDGAHGAILTWSDTRNGNADVYAHHVLASGVVDAAWPLNGRAVCTAAGAQEEPMLAEDGAGGAIVTWQDSRGGAFYDIYSQRVLASGAVDPGWPANGRLVCGATRSQFTPTLIADGAGGAVITWEDYRVGFVADVYAHHVSGAGALDPAWPADGRAISVADGDQRYPQVVTDGAGGGIITWQDQRTGFLDIYAQHIALNGVVDPAWTANGAAVCVGNGDQYTPSLVSDGAGGAVIAWIDYRPIFKSDVYAMRVRASGALDPAWPAGGAAICTDAANQYQLTLVSDLAGGAVLAWQDQRVDDDIYAQRVSGTGTLGAPVAGVSGDTHGTTLAFAAPSPNPANRSTTLRYTLPQAGRVKLSIFDASGRTVRIIEDGQSPAGSHAQAWDLTDARGSGVPAGLYFATVTTGSSSVTRRIAVTR
jgi:hypothetical protein